MSLHLQPDWLPLVGEFGEIRLAGQPVRTGTVDAVTTDNSILWLAADGGHLRAMVERTLGCEVWIPTNGKSAAVSPTCRRPAETSHHRTALGADRQRLV